MATIGILIINELLDEFHRAQYFSKLDLQSGYHQVWIREKDIKKIAFRIHHGHCEFLFMPFDFINELANISVNNECGVLGLLEKDNIGVFYDILIYS